VEVAGASPDEAAALQLPAAGPASAEGRPVQWSRNFFPPGKLALRLVRETLANRDPAIVLQLLDSSVWVTLLNPDLLRLLSFRPTLHSAPRTRFLSGLHRLHLWTTL
jgi:hypothetical protein